MFLSQSLHAILNSGLAPTVLLPLVGMPKFPSVKSSFDRERLGDRMEENFLWQRLLVLKEVFSFLETWEKGIRESSLLEENLRVGFTCIITGEKRGVACMNRSPAGHEL